MSPLREFGEFFPPPETRDQCVQNEMARGSSLPEAQRFCHGLSPTPGWPGFSFDMPPREQPPSISGGPRCSCLTGGSRTPRAMGRFYPTMESPQTPQKPKSPGERRIQETPSAFMSRWGGQDITPGFVPVGNVEAEAHIWAREMSSVGEDRVGFDRGAWEEHALRMGFTDKEVEKGWEIIEKYSHVVASLQSVFGEAAGQPLGGQYLRMMPYVMNSRQPRLDGAGPSWPWATKSAAKLFGAAQKIIWAAKKHGKLPDMDAVVAAAFEKSGVDASELAAEDDAILGIALQWEIMGKDAVPGPPNIVRARSVDGMKGTGAGADRFMATRGAP